MPEYTYRCIRCSKASDRYYTMHGKIPALVASEDPCDKGGMCDLERVWSANYGIGVVYGAGGAPARQT